MQKALARSLCTKNYCWQQDSDEIVHESDYSKIRNLIKNFPKNVELLALPVIEYWGGPEKVRLDINPVAWRRTDDSDAVGQITFVYVRAN